MFKSRALAGAFVVSGIAAASIFAAAPASAAVLPAGQQITVVDYYEWQFSDANSATAVLTPIGTGAPVDGTNVTAVDVDDTGHGYALTTDYVPTPPIVCDPEDLECIPEFGGFDAVGASLHTADATTGTLGAGTTIQIETGPLDEIVLADADECLALDFSKGQLVAACQIYGEGASAWIGILDPATAILSPRVLLVDEDFIQFQSIAINPINGEIWGFDADESAFIITLDNSVPDYIGSTEMSIYAADFDRGGQLWVSAFRPTGPPAAEIGEGENGLATLDLGTGEFPFNARWSDADATIDALTVWGALAATGAVQNPATALGAGALVLFGAIMAAGTMAIRRRSVEI